MPNLWLEPHCELLIAKKFSVSKRRAESHPPGTEMPLSPIHESSTTASIQESDEYEQLDIEDLFAELKKTHTVSVDTDDEFTRIKKSIAKLPKIEAEQRELKKKNVVSIADPVAVTKKNKEVTHSGSNWFDMPKGELTESVKRDLKVIQQRAALDPKRHYKKDKWKTPEFFQMGTIVESKAEFFSSRLKNKDRHQTILESVMYDDDTKKYFKRKYDDIQANKSSGKRMHYKKTKEARRKY